MSCVVLIATFGAHADFNIKGDLKVIYPTGQTKDVDMSLSYQASEYDHKFKVGKYEYSVTGQPERYSFALVLQKNNFLWVQEFTKGYFEGFEWTLGDHKLKLYKEVLAKPVMGDYILTIDDKDYFFQKRLAQLTVIFDEDGVKEIEVDGMVASLGLNKAKDAKCDPEKDDECQVKEDN
jgi:hypothetical protein